MAGPAGSAWSEGDPYAAGITDIGFVVHRQRPRGWNVRHRGNPRYEIMAFAAGGRAHYRFGGADHVVTRGSLLLFPRRMAHDGDTDQADPWTFFSVAFRLAPRDRGAWSVLPVHVTVDRVDQVVELFERLEQAWRQRETGYSLACRGLVMALLQRFVVAATATRGRDQHEAAIDRVVQLLRSEPRTTWTAAELAARVGLSESRFRLLFKRQVGMPVTRYQNLLRIRAGRDLLSSGHYSVTEVAEELGFSDVYYFSRLFKQVAGEPPSRYLP